MSDAVRLTRLPNGLTVVSEVMPRVETVSFGAYVATGTRNETAAENGVSHFLEHMAFKGTEKRDAAAIAREIENVGGHLNAYTARENTAYYCKVLKEDLPLAADIIGDILTHSTFAPEELERERGVILQEIGQANDTPDDIVFDHFQMTAYPDQPMGRPTLGTEDVIREMKRETLVEYMRHHYGPERMVVAAAGALDHDRLLELVQTHFADLPTVAPAPPEPARYVGGEFREERDLDQVHIVLGFPATGYKDRLHYPSLLLSTLLGGGMSSRLFQEIREKRGLVYSIYSFAHPFRDGGLFAVYAGTGETEAEELVPVTLEELRKVQRDVTQEELDRAKAQFRASLLMSLESTGSRTEQLARQIQVHGRVIPVEETKAKIAAVTIAEVQEAAAAAFRAAPTLAALGPAGKVPGLPQIAERLAA
ncbi:insulinase family protein [Siccirubricoccus sp. KC 17139]|uniref:Insulinase family protein n=1 Tax=Siccirubricoccus soli TaxID=2899147 RepID=A0ABT1D1H8_9PROT|nr:pitrilysin family protein [Siccirubricoccus soli]MCO6415766.1 insulinase family protein [Siccirubricoccus soli]MCP2681898.1 insulinase family protein [Siccirubricoccus soli]